VVAFTFLRGRFFFVEVLRLIIGNDGGDPYRERIQLPLRQLCLLSFDAAAGRHHDVDWGKPKPY
jgi:hypothetical protein